MPCIQCYILSSFLARLLINCWNCCILHKFSSRDSSVGRAEDCRVHITVILRSVVQIRLAGMYFFIFRGSTHVYAMYVIAQFNLFSKILIFIHKENPVNQKKKLNDQQKNSNFRGKCTIIFQIC